MGKEMKPTRTNLVKRACKQHGLVPFTHAVLLLFRVMLVVIDGGYFPMSRTRCFIAPFQSLSWTCSLTYNPHSRRCVQDSENQMFRDLALQWLYRLWHRLHFQEASSNPGPT